MRKKAASSWPKNSKKVRGGVVTTNVDLKKQRADEKKRYKERTK